MSYDEIRALDEVWAEDYEMKLKDQVTMLVNLMNLIVAVNGGEKTFKPSELMQTRPKPMNDQQMFGAYKLFYG